MKRDWNIRCIWHRLLSVCKHRFFFFKRRYSKGLLRPSVTYITSSFPTVISFPSSYRTCQYVLLLRSTWQLYLLHLARTFHTLTLYVEKKGKKEGEETKYQRQSQHETHYLGFALLSRKILGLALGFHWNGECSDEKWRAEWEEQLPCQTLPPYVVYIVSC